MYMWEEMPSEKRPAHEINWAAAASRPQTALNLTICECDGMFPNMAWRFYDGVFKHASKNTGTED